MEKAKNRNSSIELLKFLAILMIVFVHSFPDIPKGDVVSNVGAIEFGRTTLDLQMNILVLLHNIGQMCNDIFIICSAWFLLDSKHVKASKISNMIADCFGLSLIMFGIFTCLGYRLHGVYLLRQFMPTCFNNNWFIVCYMLLYLIHPLLNRIIYQITQGELLLYSVLFLIIYCVISFVLPGGLFYYNELVGFVGIYFVVAYFKLYLPKMMKSKSAAWKFIIVFGAIWLLLHVATVFVGVRYGILSDQLLGWEQFRNPCYIFMGIGVFMLFSNNTFYNPLINNLASMSLIIYVIQCNRILRDYARFDIFDYIYNHFSYKYLGLWILLYAVTTFILSFTLGKVYLVSIGKLVRFVFNKITNIIIRIYNKFENYILKIS